MKQKVKVKWEPTQKAWIYHTTFLLYECLLSSLMFKNQIISFVILRSMIKQQVVEFKDNINENK